MKTRKVLGVVALSTLLGMGTLYAVDANNTTSELQQEQYGKNKKGMFGKHHRGGHFKKIMKQLDLTDNQREALSTLRAEKRENRKVKRKAMQTAKQITLANAITADGFNKAQFIADATAQFETKIAQKAENMEKMFAILTPEQRTKFVELLKEEQ